MYLASEMAIGAEDFYWPIVKKILAENHLGQGVITGSKALAVMLRDYSLPEVLCVVVPQYPGRTAILGDYIMIARTIRSEKKKSLYHLIKIYATRITVENTSLLISCPEHAILESLTTRTGNDIRDTALIHRWLKKNSSNLREDIFAQFLPYKYISAINRLKYLASDLQMMELYHMMIRLIDTVGK